MYLLLDIVLVILDSLVQGIFKTRSAKFSLFFLIAFNVWLSNVLSIFTIA